MIRAETLDRAKATDDAMADRVRQVQLLGELGLLPAEVHDLSELVRELGSGRFCATVRCPSVLAALVVEIARDTTDGREVWPSIGERLGLDPGSLELGGWFDNFVHRHRLPAFDHLVDQGARKYVTRIIAHSMVPRRLVEAFMQHVVWPAVVRPDTHGGSADEIQQRLWRNPPPQLPLALQRFVLHGGRVARDLVDRCILFSVSVREASPDTGAGLPDWLTSDIRLWIASNGDVQSGVVRAGPRLKSPSLRYDVGLGRVYLELPYQDAGLSPAAEWEIVGSPHIGTVRLDACAEIWARSGPYQELEIERPMTSLQVSLVGGLCTIATWPVPAVSPEQPALFFSATSGKARSSGTFLEGDSWIVVRPASLAYECDGELVVTQGFGPPSGSWGNYIAEQILVANASYLGLHGVPSSVMRLISDPPRARVEAAAPPAYLGSVDDAIVAFEDRLPEVVIPFRSGSDAGDKGYLRLWQLVATNEETGDQFAASPSDLTVRTEKSAWVIGIQDLILAEDVGTWRIDARGPLGLSISARLALLPALDIVVSDDPAICIRNGLVREVVVDTPDPIMVLEQGDEARQVDGSWVLYDKNRNGRIPFTVRDLRTLRQTTAVFLLPTAHWRWRGGLTKYEPATPAALDLNELLAQTDLALEITATSPVRPFLSALAPDGKVLQTVAMSGAPGVRATTPARDFSTTIAESGYNTVYLQLSLRKWDGTVQDSAIVGAVTQGSRIQDLSAEFENNELVFRWSHAGAAHRLSAELRSEFRPWDDTEAVAVILHDGQGEARFVESPSHQGKYSFRLFTEDRWVGKHRVYSRRLTIGTEAELTAYLRSLSNSPVDNLERALARPASAAVHLRSIASGLTADGADGLIDAITKAVARPLSAEWANLPWWELAHSLGDSSADVVPLLSALGNAEPSRELRTFVQRLNLPRWRAVWRQRSQVSESARRGLWALWAPLGAILDLSDASEGALERSQQFMGNSLAHMRSRQDLAVALGLLSVGGATGVYRLDGGPLLSEGAWQRGLQEANDLLSAALLREEVDEFVPTPQRG